MAIRPTMKVSQIPEVASLNVSDLVMLFNKDNGYQPTVMEAGQFSSAASEGGSAVVVTAAPIVANARYVIATSAVTITLPNSSMGTMKTVKGTVSGVIVAPASGTIDGSATAPMILNQSLSMISDGTNWWIV